MKSFVRRKDQKAPVGRNGSSIKSSPNGEPEQSPITGQNAEQGADEHHNKHDEVKLRNLDQQQQQKQPHAGRRHTIAEPPRKSRASSLISNVRHGMKHSLEIPKSAAKTVAQGVVSSLVSVEKGLHEVLYVPIELEQKLESHAIPPPLKRRRRRDGPRRSLLLDQRSSSSFHLEPDGHSQRDAKLPPDSILDDRMTIVLNKRIAGLSVSQLYDSCWSQGHFFEDWLRQDGKFNIDVGEWQIADATLMNGSSSSLSLSSSSFQNSFDGQSYSQRRIVKYSYERDPSTVGYRLGKPKVDVTQTQYYRLEVSDHDEEVQRSILMMQLESDGEVFADSFLVHIRGVATSTAPPRTLEKQQHHRSAGILLDFGVTVQFTKPTMFRGQIESISENTSRDSLADLFRMLVDKVDGATEVDREEPLVDFDEEEDDEDGDQGGGGICCL